MGAGEEILKNQARIEAKLDRLLAHLGADRPSGAWQTQGGRVASVDEVGGDRGDPKIGKDPARWKGQRCEGLRASQCPPEFLDVYADFLDWKADNPREGKEKYAKYERLDAARCRRWAVEIREGRVNQTGGEAPPTPRSNEAPPAQNSSWDDDGAGTDGDWNGTDGPF